MSVTSRARFKARIAVPKKMLMVREEDLLSIWAQLAFIPFSGKPLRALIWGLVSESSL